MHYLFKHYVLGKNISNETKEWAFLFIILHITAERSSEKNEQPF